MFDRVHSDIAFGNSQANVGDKNSILGNAIWGSNTASETDGTGRYLINLKL